MAIERDFDVAFVAGIALREKQVQQNYRPVIAVHKWFARRPGTLFRALLLAEFGSGPVAERFFQANCLQGIHVADPFMGGGTPLLEANRLGCDVIGFDINPMAYWIVRQEIDWLDVNAYRQAAARLTRALEQKLGHLYRTRCLACGSETASAKYYLWVKTQPCGHCGHTIDLFPGYLVSEDRRHPLNVFVCPACGDLTETSDRKRPGACRCCGKPLMLAGPAKSSRCPCPSCGTGNRYPKPALGPPRHRMFAIEYHCYDCKSHHEGRYFKKPDEQDLARYAEAKAAWSQTRPTYAPRDPIPAGDETDRLHRWGYRLYREMFNDRQLLGLETSARLLAKEKDERVRNALATNLSDLLRYQNMLCRYDTGVLKSLDVFSVHGFPVGLVQCESNLLGITGASVQMDLFGEADSSGATMIGSGGWANIIEKYARAKAYCARPFEVQYLQGRKMQVGITGEWIGDVRPDASDAPPRNVDLRCHSATQAHLAAASLDAVFTDPPYFSNVQYAELMDFCYVWLRRLIGSSEPAFRAPTTRSPDELTGNATMDRGLDHFAEGLSEVFRRMAKALKPGRPLAFTYHNNDLAAYYPIAVAILDAGLACTGALPCPAEMAASVHINGTGSSVIDTIFVCRSPDVAPAVPAQTTPAAIALLVHQDVLQLRHGGVDPTPGDVRCIVFGHLIRLAIEALRSSWRQDVLVHDRLAAPAAWVKALGGPDAVRRKLPPDVPPPPPAATRGTRHRRGATNARLPL